MRLELLNDRPSSSSLAVVPVASQSTGTPLPEACPPRASGSGSGQDLYDLIAVILGVCQALSETLEDSPQHAELARIALLAADRAAGLAADLRGQAMPYSMEAHPIATDDPAPAGERPRRVLVVEDDPDLLTLLTAAFMREGFQTFSARNGRVGVEMLRTLQPDLMVTDIVMPEMEGIGTIMEARRSSPGTRVIAISGGGHYGRSQNFLVWAHELGADEVLAKPFRMSSLIMAARVVLDRPSPPPDGRIAATQ
jgi:CheY-like chemotaxis protein